MGATGCVSTGCPGTGSFDKFPELPGEVTSGSLASVSAARGGRFARSGPLSALAIGWTMHRATDAGTVSKTAVLVNNYS